MSSIESTRSFQTDARAKPPRPDGRRRRVGASSAGDEPELLHHDRRLGEEVEAAQVLPERRTWPGVERGRARLPRAEAPAHDAALVHEQLELRRRGCASANDET